MIFGLDLCRPRIKYYVPSQRPQNCPCKAATQNRKMFCSINDRISSLWLLIYRHISKEDEEIFWSPFQCGLGFLCSFRLISSGTTIFLLAVALSSEALLLLKIVTSLDKRNLCYKKCKYSFRLRGKGESSTNHVTQESEFYLLMRVLLSTHVLHQSARRTRWMQ